MLRKMHRIVEQRKKTKFLTKQREFREAVAAAQIKAAQTKIEEQIKVTTEKTENTLPAEPPSATAA